MYKRQPDDLYVLTPSKKEKASNVIAITAENKHILDQLAPASVKQRWVKTTDGKEELVWIVLPPHFDANKKDVYKRQRQHHPKRGHAQHL